MTLPQENITSPAAGGLPNRTLLTLSRSLHCLQPTVRFWFSFVRPVSGSTRIIGVPFFLCTKIFLFLVRGNLFLVSGFSTFQNKDLRFLNELSLTKTRSFPWGTAFVINLCRSLSMNPIKMGGVFLAFLRRYALPPHSYLTGQVFLASLRYF